MQDLISQSDHSLIATLDAPEESAKWLKAASNYRPDWVLPTNSYPGLWAKVPNNYFQFIHEVLQAFSNTYNYSAKNIRRVSCNYALVTQKHESLNPFQTIPHFDTPMNDQIALVHYLCDEQFGGTGFYQHVNSKITRVNRNNHDSFVNTVKQQLEELDPTTPEYIADNHPLFKRTHYEHAQFGRLVAYPANLLHSACIPTPLPESQDLRSGRLTITSFITLGEEI